MPHRAGGLVESARNQHPRQRKTAPVKATLRRKLSDPYLTSKPSRFATDRIGDAGIVCYVNNNSFYH